MAAISRANELKQLLPGLNALFGEEYNRYENEHEEIYVTENSERSFEEELKNLHSTTYESAFIFSEDGRENATPGQVKRVVFRHAGCMQQFTQQVSLIWSLRVGSGDGRRSDWCFSVNLWRLRLLPARLFVRRLVMEHCFKSAPHPLSDEDVRIHRVLTATIETQV